MTGHCFAHVAAWVSRGYLYIYPLLLTHAETYQEIHKVCLLHMQQQVCTSSLTTQACHVYTAALLWLVTVCMSG